MFTLGRKRKRSTPQWHCIRLEAAQLAEREHERIRLLFSWFYMAAHQPRGMNLLLAPNDAGGADIYLSPQAIPSADNLVSRYEAQPCDPPNPSDYPTVLIAGYGYGTHELYTRITNTRNIATTRRFLPERYHYRCVRSLDLEHVNEPWPYAQTRMSPFVRRYVKAWALSPPHAKRGG